MDFNSWRIGTKASRLLAMHILTFQRLSGERAGQYGRARDDGREWRNSSLTTCTGAATAGEKSVY